MAGADFALAPGGLSSNSWRLTGSVASALAAALASLPFSWGQTKVGSAERATVRGRLDWVLATRRSSSSCCRAVRVAGGTMGKSAMTSKVAPGTSAGSLTPRQRLVMARNSSSGGSCLIRLAGEGCTGGRPRHILILPRVVRKGNLSRHPVHRGTERLRERRRLQRSPLHRLELANASKGGTISAPFFPKKKVRVRLHGSTLVTKMFSPSSFSRTSSASIQ